MAKQPIRNTREVGLSWGAHESKIRTPDDVGRASAVQVQGIRSELRPALDDGAASHGNARLDDLLARHGGDADVYLVAEAAICRGVTALASSRQSIQVASKQPLQ